MGRVSTLQKGIKTSGVSYFSTQKHFLLNDVFDIIYFHFKNITGTMLF